MSMDFLIHAVHRVHQNQVPAGHLHSCTCALASGARFPFLPDGAGSLCLSFPLLFLRLDEMLIQLQRQCSFYVSFTSVLCIQ